jgi:uncharacterized protein
VEPDGGILGVLVDFGRALRAAGMPVGTDDVMTYCSAVSELDPSDVVDVYWAGRGALVTRREQIPVYDRVFRQHFLDAPVDAPDDPRLRMRAVAREAATLELPDPEEQGTGDDEAQLGLAASSVEVQRTKAFADCTPEELAAVRRIIDRLRLTPPQRRTRRAERAADGRRLDLRRTARAAIRSHGAIDTLHYTRRRLRIRPLVLLLDVSGSMADYSRTLLQFAWSSRRAAGRVEVFCFGTRLTRITHALDRRRPDEAMRLAAAAVSDWDGGTRIGASLDQFVQGWGRRGLSRGAVVVICSDGLDRGDPAVLDKAMERLSRLCHRIVWVTPHRGHERQFRPSTLGMMVADRYVDRVLGGSDLRSLEEFAEVLPSLR